MEQNKKAIHKAREAYLALGAFQEMAEIFETVTVKNETKDGTEFEVNVINTINKIMSDYISCIKPYKFEDLKEMMLVFDNKICDCIKIELILKDKKILCCDGFHRKFEENRFYPIQYCALLMQED